MDLKNMRTLLGILFAILILEGVIGANKSGRRSRLNKKRPQNKQGFDPDKFLEKYGYLGKIPDGVHHSPEARRESIKNFQRMVSLKVTGVLDEATRAKMAAPRCGVPDMIPAGTKLSPPGVALEPNRPPPLNFYVPGYKWAKKALTWSARSFSPDMNQGSQRRAFYNALKFWSDVTPLTFNEVGAGSTADINIHFGRYNHDDPYPFDGPGGTLAHAFFPEDGRAHFDEDEQWTEYVNSGTNLEIVAAHEFGHALGLGHSNIPNALMAPYYQGYVSNFKLHDDDIAGIQTLYDGPGTPRPPQSATTTTTVRPPVSDPERDPCTTKFDAVFQAHDSKIYVINGKYIYRLNEQGLEAGFPKDIREIYDDAPLNIRAAVYSWRSRYTFFFKGMEIYKYYGFSRIEKKTVNSSTYPDKVDAAYISRDGYIYLFKESMYYIFDETTMDVTSQGQPISSRFPGIPPDVESCVRLRDGYTYFFKGSKYRKFDEYYMSVQPGYPKDKARPWMGQVCGGYEPK